MKTEELGKTLRQYRLARHLNVKQVQQLLEVDYGFSVSEKTIYNWETGQYNVSTPKLLALLDIYQINHLNPSSRIAPNKHVNLAITERERNLILAYRKNKDLQPVIDKILDLKQT